MDASDLIQEGHHVIFDEHGEKKSIHVITRTGRAKVGKFHIAVGQLIGARWGSTYKLSADGSKLLPVTEHQPVTGPNVEEVEKDNSTLLDLNVRNQGLTAKDLADMAASGKAGEEIIEALCSNSVTYAEKTEFAQEKYKKRKARKYMTSLTLRKPTAWAMAEVMFHKAPTGIWNLRPDSMSLLLSLANVAANSRCLLLENCQGLLAAACAERMGGHGALCCVGTGGKTPGMSGLRQLNLGPQERSIVCCTQLADLQQAAQRVANGAQQATTQQAITSNDQQVGQVATQQQQQQEQQAEQQQQQSSHATTVQVAQQRCDEPDASAGTAVASTAQQPPSAQQVITEDDVSALYDSLPDDDETEQQAKRRRITGKQPEDQQCGNGEVGLDSDLDEAAAARPGQDADARQPYRATFTARPDQLEQLLRQGFNSCIIAAPRLHTGSILQEVLPLLGPSTQFAVFSPWMQPLAEAMQQLTSSRQAVLLQLQESWLRPYQVLPGRTHPHMAMTTGGTGGYILSGITVAVDTASEQDTEHETGGRRGGAAGGKRGRGGRRSKRQR